VILAKDQLEPDSSRRQLARSAHDGALERIERGVYVPRDRWESLNLRERYLARVVGVAETRRNRPVLSHWSAAAMHGLPMLGPWPTQVHITAGPAATGRSRNGVAVHATRVPDDDVVEVGGLLVTSLARTVLDLAGAASFMAAVVFADHVIHTDRFGRTPPLLIREDLEAAWERARPLRAHARTRAVIEFAETRSDTPIESVSRVNMRVIGVPRPALQVSFYDDRGHIGDSDFSWEAFHTVGEADGENKYLDAAARGGLTAEQVLLAEKYREDRIRALPRRFVRWPWKVAINPAALRRKLVAAGLPVGLPW
jgi:hypothetical protein